MKSLLDFFRKDYESNYKFVRKEIVYFVDKKYNKIRTMKINHRMSGWNYDDWEYYHCSCIDPRESWENENGGECGMNIFGGSVCEISQKYLFPTKEEAEKYLQSISSNDNQNQNVISTHCFIKKFNYDGIDHSLRCIANQAKKINDNAVLSNKAIEFLEADKKRKILAQELALELEKINFPTWDE